LRNAAVAAAGVFLAGAIVRAAEIDRARPLECGPWLCAEVRARNLLDAHTRSTIESGLPGTCVYRISLHEQDGPRIAERVLALILRFDVWNERYELQILGSEAPKEEPLMQRFTSLAAADSAWSHVAAARVVRRDRLRPERRYQLRIEALVQPLAAEDRERLSRYVREQSAGTHNDFLIDVGALLWRFRPGEPGKSQAAQFATGWFQPPAPGGSP
jgi:hypothetical protein